MKSQSQIEMLNKVGSDSFFSGVLSYVLSGVATAIILKTVWAFCSFVKWIFVSYPYLKAEIDKGIIENAKMKSEIVGMKSEMIEIKSILKKIEKELGVSNE